jgi:2-furoyl-CoA dehydrogenase 2Fe-2S iron sulfur subunit
MRRVSKSERARLSLTLNGRKLSGEAEPRMLLSDFLRHVLGATGTHVGCEHGVCGCCTVLLDGAAVRSCLTLAVQAEGRAVTTVESLADGNGKLNALQRAFQNNHALQCGFCTPGILMSFTDFLARNPDPSEAEVVEVLSGHLCRCTGYAGIVAAVLEAAKEMHTRSAPSPNQTPARRGLVTSKVAGSGQARSRPGEGWGGGS